MRRQVLAAAVVFVLAAVSATAQTVIGPAPPAVPAQPVAPDTAPAAPAPAAPGPESGQAPTPSGPLTPAPPPPSWVPKGTAKLVVVEKLATQPTTLTVPVGQSATFESLTISVRSCLVRPPDQPPDATAFLDIADSHSGAPDFHGWLFETEPQVSMFQSPVYDVILAGCT